MLPFNKRKSEIIGSISELSGEQARQLLAEIVRNIVTDTAGNIYSPFTYLWKKNWLEIESKIMKEAQRAADKCRDGCKLKKAVQSYSEDLTDDY